MQWATTYAMPLALGVTKTFSDEVDMVKEVDPIFYWYQPLELADGWRLVTRGLVHQPKMNPMER